MIKNNTLKQFQKSSQCKTKFWNFEKCPNGIKLIAECPECKNKFLQYTSCKREDCPICGKEGSVAHYRRFIEGLPKILEMYKKSGVVGYIVITWNKKQDIEINKKTFGKIRRYIIRMMKREIRTRGIARWHWGGEQSRDFYPHLNILFESGYIEKSKLERIKKLIEKKLNVKVVYYQYSRNIGKILHWWRYVSRPTFLKQNQVSYSVIKGFRNTIYFGEFEKEKEINIKEWWKRIEEYFEKGYFDVEEINFVYVYCLIRSRCPYCGEKLKWKKIDFWEYMEKITEKKRNFGGGFYGI
jgi:hypothetical protein